MINLLVEAVLQQIDRDWHNVDVEPLSETLETLTKTRESREALYHYLDHDLQYALDNDNIQEFSFR